MARRVFSIKGIVTTVILTFFFFLSGCALTDKSTAATMHILDYNGTVEIEDASGTSRAVTENMGINNEETIHTGELSSASIGVDDSKTVFMDENSRVQFVRNEKETKLTLKKGGLLLDVQEKLKDDETCNIIAPAMEVGIRGTIVYLTTEDHGNMLPDNIQHVNRTNEAETAPSSTTLGVLEGTAVINYLDANGERQELSVPAGRKLTITDINHDGLADVSPAVEKLDDGDANAFLINIINNEQNINNRVEEEFKNIAEENIYSASGDWKWTETVTLVAQSASKIYDGAPLIRTGDILVSGLPSQFSISVHATGSLTDAGSADNPIGQYHIYNASGEDVTSHFSDIETISGKLTVDPAPLVVWTGSASKIYDGTPLTSPETSLMQKSGHILGDPLWRNTSYTYTNRLGEEILYGICGTTIVHGTNPLTDEIREIELPAGKKLTVCLMNELDIDSIRFRIEDVTVEEIPDDILRLYADNSDLLEQACKDTGWDEEVLKQRISTLTADSDQDDYVVEKDLHISRSIAGHLMNEYTNVRITVDSEITSYNGRALGSQEVCYTNVGIDSSIKVTATGSQTEVGESTNTYDIDWGNANPNNFVLSEDLGTLTVIESSTPEPTPSPGPTSTPDLTPTPKPSPSPKPNPTPTLEPIPTPTPKPTSAPIPTSDPKPVPEPTPETIYSNKVTFKANSDNKIYDGTALSCDEVKVKGLPNGFTYTVDVSGSQTDVGTSKNIIKSYKIFDAKANDVTSKFTNIQAVKGTLKVDPLEITVVTEGASKTYDG
ncbi:MAG: FecR domain-containing protein, partial [Solobacterium sp.]|nr:FecR domain-containing protein [Solobacterium sp.]